MVSKNFFDYQSDLTSAKIIFFEKYIDRFLRIILMQFGECFIGDLFCGPGKNGNKDGSPLILIKKIKDIIQTDTLLKKFPTPRITISFNDNNKKYKESLEKELNKLDIPKNIEIIGPTNKDFREILEEQKNTYQTSNLAKFFFLDPFGYSNIDINDIKTIMSFCYPEVLLFIPTTFIYRFANAKKMENKTKQFLEDFTIKGPGHYNDIDELIGSIRLKLLKYVNLDFVRPIPLDGGANINTLFFLTKHIKGMINVNEIFWKFSKDGKVVDSKSLEQERELVLFDTENLSEPYQVFLNNLEKFIKGKKTTSNIEIIKFTAKEGARLKFAKDFLHQLKKKGKITVNYFTENKTRGFYVSENNWDKKFCEITYLSNSYGN